MANPRNTENSTPDNRALGFEAQLFKAADKLRGNMEPSDYKHVALGLIFLKYVSDAFEARHAQLLAEDARAAEDRDEYLADNIFWVPKDARRSHLQVRDRRGEVLFIDARQMGALVDRTRRELSDEEIARIATIYHAWRGERDAGRYADIPGFCKSATLEDIRKHGHVLTPGRYVGAAAVEDDGEAFTDKMQRLTQEWCAQQQEAARLDKMIARNLEQLGFGSAP